MKSLIMVKKRKSKIPRKPNGSIDWRKYNQQLSTISMKDFDIEIIDTKKELGIRFIRKENR